MLDAYNASEQRLSDRDSLLRFLDDLPAKLGMHKISPPVVELVGEMNRKDPGGVSGFVLIAESHISFHTFPKRRFATVDIYTCQDDLDSDLIASFFADLFETSDYDLSVIPRGERYPAENV